MVNPGPLLEGLAAPPLEWGIGRWQVSNRLLATVLPGTNEWFWGDWLAGRYERGNTRAAVFAAGPKTAGVVGEYGELQVDVPVSGHRDRLGLLIYASAANKDLFSATPVKYRWAGYRFLELAWQDKVLWEADLGHLSRTRRVGARSPSEIAGGPQGAEAAAAGGGPEGVARQLHALLRGTDQAHGAARVRRRKAKSEGRRPSRRPKEGRVSGITFRRIAPISRNRCIRAAAPGRFGFRNSTFFRPSALGFRNYLSPLLPVTNVGQWY